MLRKRKRNRTRIEIASKILEVCRRERGTSKIMSGANLSHDLFRNYVGLLERAGLLYGVQRGYQSLHRITKEGESFLMEYREVKGLEAKCREIEESLKVRFAFKAAPRLDSVPLEKGGGLRVK